jgi:hypothetical protein
LLFIVTPDAGTNCVTPEPISITLYLYPTGIDTEEFDGIVKFIVEEVLRRIVLLTSSNSKTKLLVFSITVFTFAILGSTSNL